MSEYSTFLEALGAEHQPGAAAGQQLDDTPLRELGFDSMNSVSVLLDLEEAFELTFTDKCLRATVFSRAGMLWTATRTLLSERVLAGRGTGACGTLPAGPRTDHPMCPRRVVLC